MAGYSSPAWVNGASPAINASNLLALSQAVELAQHPFGVCSTAAATAAKSVTVDFSGTLSLFTGLTVRVKFSNSNTASSPTLNVNSTGAKAIKRYGTTAATTWQAGQVIEFTYDGTNWLMVGFDSYTKTQELSTSTISDVADATGTTPTTPTEAMSALAAAVGSKTQIEVKSYTGTGTYGSSSSKRCSMTFSFTPKIVLVLGTGTITTGPDGASSTPASSYGPGILIWGITTALQYGISVDTSNYYTNTVSYSGNTMYWYNTHSETYQYNVSGRTYYLVAIG